MAYVLDICPITINVTLWTEHLCRTHHCIVACHMETLHLKRCRVIWQVHSNIQLTVGDLGEVTETMLAVIGTEKGSHTDTDC